jgi:predicted Zn-dependent peptidase
MDYHKKSEWNYGEAMLHLNRCFNKETFQKLQKAILEEIERRVSTR